MQNMQNMHNIHAELAVQERIHFSVSLGNQFCKMGRQHATATVTLQVGFIRKLPSGVSGAWAVRRAPSTRPWPAPPRPD